jgi:hypothetical protein
MKCFAVIVVAQEQRNVVRVIDRTRSRRNRHWLDYDPVALILGSGAVDLLALSI